MILDQTKNAALYKGILPEITVLLEKIAGYTQEQFPTGRVDVDGDNLFLVLSTYQTRAVQDAFFEAHQKYIDVMFMVEGEEIIYVKPTEMLSAVTQPYDAQKDVLLAKLDSDATPVRLAAGNFVVLFPQDAHAPSCYETAPGNVKKIIAKVKV